MPASCRAEQMLPQESKRSGGSSGTPAPGIRGTLAQLSNILRDSGDYAEAESALRESHTVLAGTLGGAAAVPRPVQSTTSRCFITARRPRQAETLMEQNLVRTRGSLETMIDTTRWLSRTSRALKKSLGQQEAAAELYREVCEIRLRLAKLALPGLSEAQSLTFMREFDIPADLLLDTARDENLQSVPSTIFELIWQTLGMRERYT